MHGKTVAQESALTQVQTQRCGATGVGHRASGLFVKAAASRFTFERRQRQLGTQDEKSKVLRRKTLRHVLRPKGRFLSLIVTSWRIIHATARIELKPSFKRS